MQKASVWEKSLDLIPHPEGGSYRETYVCPKKTRGRALATSIFYLLQKGERSCLHRLDADELWYHLDGQPLTIHTLSKKGGHTRHRLGKNPRNGEEPMLHIPAGTIFGAELPPGTDYCLSACVVAPGFVFEKFDLLPRKELLEEYPEHAELITRLTNNDQESASE
jgi:predicted cupin superfamily sugar epimerase